MTAGWTVPPTTPTACAHTADPVPATVLDPFGGTGTTAVVAQRLGRRAILVELSDEYIEHARRRASRAWGEGGGPPPDRDPEIPEDSWLAALG